MLLKDVCKIKTNFKEANFWLQRKGSERTVGQPTKEFFSENIGIQVLDPMILPDFLYYYMQYLFSTGYWQRLSYGTLNLKNIRTEDVANLEIRRM